MGAGVGIITAALPRKKAGVTDNGHVSDTEHAAPHSHHYHPRPSEGKASSSGHGSLSANSPYASYPSYGSFGSADGNSRIRSSPERLRRDSQTLLNRVPEDGAMEFELEAGEGPRYTGGAPLDEEEQDMEEELELDAQLAAQGLYRGTRFFSLSFRLGSI